MELSYYQRDFHQSELCVSVQTYQVESEVCPVLTFRKEVKNYVTLFFSPL